MAKSMEEILKSEALMQLFVYGPTWDGNLVSKSQRDDLLASGLADHYEGWNYLTFDGVKAGIEGGLKATNWVDQRWYKKASLQ